MREVVRGRIEGRTSSTLFDLGLFPTLRAILRPSKLFASRVGTLSLLAERPHSASLTNDAPPQTICLVGSMEINIATP
jgi:hypothetical protein